MNTTIILTPIDLEKYEMFKKHYDLFKLMQAHGVFNIKYGKCILNFYQGDLANITKEEMVYSAKYK